MPKEKMNRSACPINLSVELLGDKWSLLVLRDIMFNERRHFRELLTQSAEKIASNVLAARLQWLTEHGMLTRASDPTHMQKVLYSLTPAAIELAPVLIQLGAWGGTHTAADPRYARPFAKLTAGGPEAWTAVMDHLRATHLEPPTAV